MDGKWHRLLSDEQIRNVFKAELQQRIDSMYEEGETLVSHVWQELHRTNSRQQLLEEFVDVFDEDANDMANWCWDRLEQLSSQFGAQDEKSPDELLLLEEEGELPADDATDEQQQTEEQQGDQVQPKAGAQAAKRSKHQPIKFDLPSTAIETAPVKASTAKAKQLGVTEAATATTANSKTAPASTDRHSKHEAAECSRTSGKQEQRRRNAVTALKSVIAPAADRSGNLGGSRQVATAAAGAAGGLTASPLGQRQLRSQVHVPAPDTELKQAAGRGFSSSSKQKSNLVKEVARASRHMFGRALQQAAGGGSSNRPGSTGRQRQPAQQQQQQQQQQKQGQGRGQVPGKVQKAGYASDAQQQVQQHVEQNQQQRQVQQQPQRVSVLQRLGSHESDQQQEQQPQMQQQAAGKSSVFARLSGTPGQQSAVQDNGTTDVNRHSMQARLGTSVGAAAKQQQQSPSSNSNAAPQGQGASVAQQKQAIKIATGQQQQQQPPDAADVAMPQAAKSVVGAKRKASAEALVPAAASVNGTQAAAAVQPAKPHAAKRPAVAAAATATGAIASSRADSKKAAEMAALKAILAAKEAEVKRLQALKQFQQQQQEVDERSIVVFGVSPRAPEAVVKAHFSGCGSIKRVTLLPGRLASPLDPGAYVEFGTSIAVLAALGLSNTVLLDQQIQVARKADYETNRKKGQRSFAVLRAGPRHTSWAGQVPPAVLPTVDVAMASETVAEQESPGSLGNMGLDS